MWRCQRDSLPTHRPGGIAVRETLVSGFRVSFPGPFSKHDVIVDGWKVPLIHAHPTGESDDKIMLVLDDRLADTFTVEEAERFVPFLADAISVALGYTSHPNEDVEPPLLKQPQPRPVKTHSIVWAETEEVDGSGEVSA
jgi:hypothetical protein